jgi:8-oxo-dGTP pyrophosphatase MutT (NUDIX family)
LSATITWNCTADQDSCDNCLALDGEDFTPDTLPGWPGDGSFGNDVLCEGGPRCRCWLTYSDDSGNVATGTSDLADQYNAGALSGDLGPAGQIAQWTAGQEAFIDTLPDVVMPNEVYSAQARAAMRLQVRQQIAQQLGMNPADVSASAVAAQVPAIYKSMKPSMKVVYDLLRKNYPDKAIEWIGQMKWGYRDAVPVEDISVTGPSSESDAKSIRKKVKKIKKGKPIKPLILIDPGDGGLLQVADGHHRCAAAVETDTQNVPAYVGKVNTDDDWRREVMDMQMVRVKKMHGTPGGTLDVIAPSGTLNGETDDFEESGTGPTSEPYMPGGHLVVDPSADPVAHSLGPSLSSKNFSLASPLATGFVPFDLSGPDITIKFAGLLVQALDSGRVLMLQRSLEEDDPAAGQWEIPGGHLEPDEEPLEAAMREWQEEVGSVAPPLKIIGRWVCANGYEGFLGLCKSESDIDIHSREVVNPDDPDSDNAEAVAWFYPADLASMPGVRQETRDNTPWSRIIQRKVAA